MLKRSVAALTVLLLTTSAHAEEPAPPPVAAGEEAPAPAVAPDGSSAPKPPAEGSPARVPPVFMDQFLSYDDDAEVASQGHARQRLSPVALYAALDRPDLIEKSRQAVQRRIILAVAAGTVLVAGVTAAVVAEVGQPNLNGPSCVKVYPSSQGPGTDFPVVFNPACTSSEMLRTTVAAVGIVGGISLGALLGTLAYWSGPSVLSNNETEKLISDHNGVLLKRLRENSAIHVTPYGSAQGAGLVTTLTF